MNKTLRMIGVSTLSVFFSLSQFACAQPSAPDASRALPAGKRIFFGDRYSAHVICFAVQEPSGELQHLPSCDANYANIVAGARVADLEFYDNCLYMVDSSGGTMGVMQFDPSTDMLKHPLAIPEPVMGWALYHYNSYFYIPGELESTVAAYKRESPTSCNLKMVDKPLYVGNYLVGPSALQPIEGKSSLFFNAALNSNNVTIFRQSSDGQMQNTGVSYALDGIKPRFLQQRNGYLYSNNQLSSSVTIFHIGQGGRLTKLRHGGTVPLRAQDPSRFVIVRDHGYAVGMLSGSIEVFDFCRDGRLVSKQNAVLPNGAMPFSFHIDRESHSMYISTMRTNFILSVKVLANGQLDTSTFKTIELGSSELFSSPWWLATNF